MSGEKTCRWCGEQHWPYEKCADPSAQQRRENERRDRQQAEQRQTAPLVRINEGRTGLQEPQPVLLNFEQIAPGVYMRPNTRQWKGVG